jgi:hypothetical protein
MTKIDRYIIVDGFYRNPDKIRNYALQTEFDDHGGSGWMGSHSVKRAPATRETLLRISSLISKDHVPNWEELDAMYKVQKRIVCGGFAALLQRQLGAVHAHGNAGDYIGIVYLSHPNDCKERKATLFFRHRQTGMEALGPDIELNRTVYKDRFDYAKWQVTDAIDMRYNRLVLFDARYFHGPSPGFGTQISNSRLIQVFCFTLQPRSVYNEHP